MEPVTIALVAILWPVPLILWVLLGMCVMDAVTGDRRLSDWVMAAPRGIGFIAACLWPAVIVAWFSRL